MQQENEIVTETTVGFEDLPSYDFKPFYKQVLDPEDKKGIIFDAVGNRDGGLTLLIGIKNLDAKVRMDIDQIIRTVSDLKNLVSVGLFIPEKTYTSLPDAALDPLYTSISELIITANTDSCIEVMFFSLKELQEGIFKRTTLPFMPSTRLCAESLALTLLRNIIGQTAPDILKAVNPFKNGCSYELTLSCTTGSEIANLFILTVVLPIRDEQSICFNLQSKKMCDLRQQFETCCKFFCTVHSEENSAGIPIAVRARVKLQFD